MDFQDGVGLGIVQLGDAFYEQEETDDFQLLVYALVGFLSLELILCCVGILSKCPGVYFCLVLTVLLIALGIRINLFTKKKLGHVLINVRSHVWYWDGHFLIPLDRDPNVLRIGALDPGITCQGLVGSSKLVGLGSCTHVIYVTLQVLGYSAKS